MSIVEGSLSLTQLSRSVTNWTTQEQMVGREVTKPTTVAIPKLLAHLALQSLLVQEPPLHGCVGFPDSLVICFSQKDASSISSRTQL